MDVCSGRLGVVVIDELESNFGKFVHLGNSYPSEDDSDEEDGSQEIEPYGPKTVKKCIEKCPSSDDDEPETSLQLLFSEGPLQPALSVVSAMKGSREKQGAPPRELSVSWAADVYDPIINSLSQTVKSKQKKTRKDRDNEIINYKNKGKKCQRKGDYHSKEKKQVGKAGGRRYDRGAYKTLYTYDTLDEFD